MDILVVFEKIWEREIPEFKTKAYFFKHKKTGAEILILENNDNNKAFGISFRTIPQNSTGVAHILEHSVLNGSKKFPVKEPFVELMKTSVNTYLNALTFPDKTVYPFSSQNEQDLYNIMDVYLDAVFHPLLKKEVFEQEGWHYEVNENGSLNIKGVVYNEMKGARSNADSLIEEYIKDSLFPGTFYENDSGGDPLVIPDLTYEEFLDFHKKYYHPSNAKICFYGNGSMHKHLEFIENYLKDFGRVEVDSEITITTGVKSNEIITKKLPVGGEENEKQYITVKSWRFDNIQPIDRLGLGILSYMLHHSNASPMKKALIESDLGESFTPVQFDRDYYYPIFSIGLKGARQENLEKIEQTIMETLSDLSQNIDKKLIEAALNRIEFELRENRDGYATKGIGLFRRSLETWNYEGDPLSSLLFEENLADIRSQGQEYFQDLIKTYFLENTNCTTLRLIPDPKFISERTSEEEKLIKSRQARLGGKEVQKIKSTFKEFTKWQEEKDSPEEINKIPRLKIQDIDKKPLQIPAQQEELKNITVLRHDLETNGIIYLDIGFDLGGLEEKLLPYLNVFSELLIKLGTTKTSYEEVAYLIDSLTGGVGSEVYIAESLGGDEIIADSPGGSEVVSKLFLSGKSMSKNYGKLLEILQDLIKNLDLDQKDRVKKIISQKKSKIETDLVESGHIYAFTYGLSKLVPAYHIKDQINGIEQLKFLQELVKRIDANWEEILSDLIRIKDYLNNRSIFFTNITCTEELYELHKSELVKFLSSFERKAFEAIPIDLPVAKENEAFIIPASINYVSLNTKIKPEDCNGSIYALSKVINRDYLWSEVRAKGGAYGAFFIYDIKSGAVSFVSYRDPNVINTLEAYEKSAEYLLNTEFTQEAIEGAIISATGTLDDYMEPDEKGWTSMEWYLTGISNEKRQQMRDQLLETDVNDLKEFAKILQSAIRINKNVAVLGNKDTLEEAVSNDKNIFVIRKIL